MSNIRKFKNAKGQSVPHLYQDDDTKEFWAVIRVGKKIRKKNLKTKSYVEAMGLLPGALAELGSLKDEEKQKRETNRLIRDYWADLKLEKVANETADSTLKRMDTVWKHNLEPYLGDWRPDQVKPDMMPAFILWHREEHPKVQLMNTFKYLGNLLNYMARVGAIQVSQVPVIKLPKSEKLHHEKKKGRIATDVETRTILERGSSRMKLINGVLEALGMRVMEFVAIEKDRIKLEEGRYFLELTEDDTKTGLARILPVPRHLMLPLKLQMLESGDSKWLFPARNGKHLPYQMINKEWLALKETANISGKLRLHDWRHRRATLMAKANVNPIVACTLLGMSMRIYQKVYAQLTGRDLVETVDQMHEGRA